MTPKLKLGNGHDPTLHKQKIKLEEKWGLPCNTLVKTSPSNASSIPGWGAETPYASWQKHQKIKQKQYCNKFNKDLKNGPHKKNVFKKIKRKMTYNI